MTIAFDGQVVLVTGAGAGLGRSHALLLARLGARVVVNDLGTSPDGTGADSGPAADVVREIVAAGGEAVPDVHSVADPTGAAAAVATALDTFGRLDGVVNNAGIVRFGTFHRQDPVDVRAVLDVHLLGSIFVTRAAWEHLGAHGVGRVVCTSSSIGLLGSPGQAAYAMAKTALVGLTRALAAEGAPLGIAANAIAPMATTRLNRDVMVELFGAGADELTPDRVAPVVAYLCHPSCRLNGEVLSVAGGRMARFAQGGGPATAGPLPPESVGGRLAELLATAPTRWWERPDVSA